MSKSSIWPIHRTLLGAITPGQSGPGSKGNEGVLCIPQSSSITGASLSYSLVSYLCRGFLPLRRDAVRISYSPTGSRNNRNVNLSFLIYIYIYIYMCVCVCVYKRSKSFTLPIFHVSTREPVTWNSVMSFTLFFYRSSFNGISIFVGYLKSKLSL